MSSNEYQKITEQIEYEISTCDRATTLSNRLFGANGLFQRLGGENREERTRIIDTELFQRARARLRELKDLDAQEFIALVDKVRQEKSGERVSCSMT